MLIFRSQLLVKMSERVYLRDPWRDFGVLGSHDTGNLGSLHGPTARASQGLRTRQLRQSAVNNIERLGSTVVLHYPHCADNQCHTSRHGVPWIDLHRSRFESSALDQHGNLHLLCSRKSPVLMRYIDHYYRTFETVEVCKQ